MTVNISKPAVNVREKLAELDKPTGIAGEAMLRAETPQEQFNLIGAGRRNLIINGAMKVAQRGTSVTGVTTGGYRTCDRWHVGVSAGTHTVTQDSSGPDGFANSLKIECTATGGDNNVTIEQRFEGQDLQRLAYGTSSANQITLSFWVKSNVVGRYTAELYNNDSSRQVSKTYNVTSSGTWEYKTLTYPADTNNGFGDDTGLSLYLLMWISTRSDFTSGTQNTDAWASVTNANRVNSDLPDFVGTTGNYFQITGVQLELGKVATPFEHRSYGEELALCQRYYYKINSADNNAPYQRYAVVSVETSTNAEAFFQHPVTMRTNPTLEASAAANFHIYSANTATVLSTNMVIDQSSPSTTGLALTVASGLTAGRAGLLNSNNNNTSYIAFNAEL